MGSFSFELTSKFIWSQPEGKSSDNDGRRAEVISSEKTGRRKGEAKRGGGASKKMEKNSNKDDA